MRRLAILTILLTALSVVGSLGFLRAFSDAGHPFAATWCDSPVVVPLASQGGNDVVTPAEGVSVGRGAEVSVGTRGPAIRLNGVGSRAQVDFGQTLFHTQWLFSSVTAGDSVRLDAVIGSARQPITASSVRGALTSAEFQPASGLIANSIDVPAGTGEIDVFSGSTGVLFTNEGATPVEIIAAIGCPALDLGTEQLSPPVWDEDSQRFVAEHVVRIQNQLPNPRIQAVRSTNSGVASSVVEDVTINLNLAAAGFSSAELLDVTGVGALDGRLNESFDGNFDTALLANPLLLTDTEVQEFTFSVAYEPNFDDPIWEEGVGVPAPQISVVGRVDSVQVGLSGTLGSSLSEVDRSVSPSLLVTPEPGLVLELDDADEPALTSSGRIALSHELTLINNGDTTVSDLVVDYPLVELLGPGTVIESVQATGRGACAAQTSEFFDGDATSTVLFDADGIGAGERCTISIESLAIPGIQPADSGTTYDAPLTVSARSGARIVRDVSSIRARLFQDSTVEVAIADTEVTNLENGGQQVDGSIVIENTGALDLSGISVVLRTERPGEETGSVPEPVLFQTFVGDDACVGAGGTASAVPSAFVSGGVQLLASQSCAVDFSFVAFPGAAIEDWTITGEVRAPLTAVQPEVAESGSTRVDFPIAPSLDSSIEIESTTNNANGTYSVRATSTLTNSGDTPLVAISVSDSFAQAFGDQLLSHDVIGDSCTGVSFEFPLRTALIAPDAHTCTVTTLSLIEPGADLEGSEIDVEAVATSTALTTVETNATSERVGFTESPRLVSLVSVEGVERLDQETVAFVISGTVENTGDVEARNAQIELDLDAAFALESGDVAYDVQFVNVFGLAGNERFDGRVFGGILTGEQSIAAGAEVGFRLLVHAQPGDKPGPYRFEVEPSATSPALAEFSSRTSSASTTVPVIGIVDRSIEAENNNNGTYSITHSVIAENAGSERLDSIQIFTGFERAFGPILVGEIDVTSTCTNAVAAGERCEVTRTATVRPGSNIGPYDVDVSIAATGNDSVEALVIPEAASSADALTESTQLTFDEDPGVQVATNVEDFENNGDGTYSITYEAVVTNTGDVPLYRVGLTDFASATFGETIVSDVIATDTCALVSFSESLSPNLGCEQIRTVTVRPLANLGPWDANVGVTADSPAFTLVEGEGNFESVTFTEDVAIDVETTLSPGTNNGDGTYVAEYELVLENTSDVPLIEVLGAAETRGFGDSLRSTDTREDSCSIVSASSPLAPGGQCRVEQGQLLAPGADLGPMELNAAVSARSASGEVASVDQNTNAITFIESPEIELESTVISVDATEDGQFRVVAEIAVRNGGDVRIDELGLELDLDQVFPNIDYRVEGAFSNDLFIAEEFALGETTDLLSGGQSLVVDAEGRISLVFSVQPGTDVGPFVGDLRASGTSPAGEQVTSVINLSLELPSVAVSVIAQSVDNNRDGSYTVTSSYELLNDGTTDLEFVQLNEDLAAIFAGTNVRLLSIDADGIAAANIEDGQRGTNLVEWGAGLAAGERAVLTSTVEVTPGNILGPFQPAVFARAASPTGTETFAEATNMAPIEFVEQPALRVEQRQIGRPVWDGNRFSVNFEITVINDGDVELRGVQVREDLLHALGAGSRIDVLDVRSETLTINSRFDGLGQPPLEDGTVSTSTRDIGDTRLLGGGDTIAAGTAETIELDVVITPAQRGVYNTRVVVSARTPAGADLGGGDEAIEANTLTRLSVQGELGLAKQVLDEAVLQADGSIAVTYEILVENAGPFPLDNVTVHDRLSQAFGLGSVFETSAVRVQPGSPCDGFTNPTYDGGTIDSALVSGVALTSGQRCRIQYDAVVVPSTPLPGPYRSSAFAIGTDPFSGTVLDDSTDGTNSDPDGNQEPGDNDIATPVTIAIPEPTVQIALEALPAGPLEASGRFEVQYLVTVRNEGAIDIISPRVVAALSEQWDDDFDIIAVESDSLIINDAFNGSNETNLIDSRNQLVAGDRHEIVLTVRAEQPASGELVLDLDFEGFSVVGEPVATSLGEPVASGRANGAIQTSLFDGMTTQEKRLFSLGTAAIFLFLILFVRSVIRRVRRIGGRDDGGSEVQAELAVFDLTDDELYVARTLRERNRPLAPVIDLTRDESDSDRKYDRHHGEHHKARRRRGRRPQRQND